jgi:cytoskeletal protein CcmA (bactofilin family)
MIAGNAALRAGDTICNGALSGSHANVIVPEGAACNIRNARIQGNVEVKRDAGLTVEGPAYIGGNVQSEGGRYVRLLGSGVTVDGSVQLKYLSAASGMQPGTQVRGNFQYGENHGFLFVSGSFIRGDFQMLKNTGGASLTNNTIRQNMQCKENYPPPSGGGNVAGGSREDQCSGL